MERPTICVPIRASSSHKIIKLASQAEQGGADLVEIWLDEISDREIEKVISKIELPIVCVCKGPEEKGTFQGSERDRIAKLEFAATLGVDYIDVGIGTDPELFPQANPIVQLIVSYHNFETTPEIGELKTLINKAVSQGADVVKIATTAVTESDNDTVLVALDYIKSQGKNGLVMCMSELGRRSRLEAHEKGALWTFAALNKDHLTAPGQLLLDEIVKS